MKIQTSCLLIIASVLTLRAQPVDTVVVPAVKPVLFVYDLVDDQSSFFISTFRTQLQAAGISFVEAAVESQAVVDLSRHDQFLVYSRVMAFNLKSPVRKWLKSLPDLSQKKVVLVVTANRWFAESNFKELCTLITGRKGTLVDAISMATQKMSPEQKVETVKTAVTKLVNK